MSRDGGRSRGTGGRDDRSPGRRRFLAAAGAGLAGLGALGAHLGVGVLGRPTPRDGGNATGSPTGNETATTEATRESTTAEADRDGGGPVLGANLNGRPRRLLDAPELLEASGTRWVRAFLDVRNKLAAGGDPADDPDVRALELAAREFDCRLAVSLKWDFTANWGDKQPARVPEAGSRFERKLTRCAARYLQYLGSGVDVVVLGNEPMWETQAPDIRAPDPAIVRFTRDVKEYLVAEADLDDPTYLVGSFNRIHDETLREEWFPEFYAGMVDLVHADEDVSGVDLHLHYDALAEAEAMLAVVREDLPAATFTASEFCPVWRYDRFVDAPITDSESGEAFAREHDLPAGMTAAEYFQEAKRDPRPPTELAAFYDAMPWYNVDHLVDVHDLLADYDVSIGTAGFVQTRGMRAEDWTTDWLPFHINFLFQPALLRTDGGLVATANPHYIDDYRERAMGTATVEE